MFSSRPSTWLCRRSNCTNCTLRHLSSDSVLWGTAEAVTGPSYSSLSDDCPRGYDGNHRTVLLNMREEPVAVLLVFTYNSKSLL